MSSNFQSTYDALIQFNIPTVNRTTVQPPTSSAPPNLSPKEQAIKIAGDTVYEVQGQIPQKCAQLTYHIAYYYKEVQKGLKPSGKYLGRHGNANQQEYRDNIVKLGYKMAYLGVLTKKDLVARLNAINTVGTIVCYRSITKEGLNSKQEIAYTYGHTCIYTNGVLALSKKSKWAASFGNNYGGPFVYGSVPSNQWEYYLFTEI